MGISTVHYGNDQTLLSGTAAPNCLPPILRRYKDDFMSTSLWSGREGKHSVWESPKKYLQNVAALGIRKLRTSILTTFLFQPTLSSQLRSFTATHLCTVCKPCSNSFVDCSSRNLNFIPWIPDSFDEYGVTRYMINE